VFASLQALFHIIFELWNQKSYVRTVRKCLATPLQTAFAVNGVTRWCNAHGVGAATLIMVLRSMPGWVTTLVYQEVYVGTSERAVALCGWKVNTGSAESNGRQPGLWLRWPAGSLSRTGIIFGNHTQYRNAFTFFFIHSYATQICGCSESSKTVQLATHAH